MMTGLLGIVTFGIIAGIGLLAYFVTEHVEKKEKEGVCRRGGLGG